MICRVLSFLSAAVFATQQRIYCSVTAASFLNSINRELPRTECLYSALWLSPIQKMRGGYLVHLAPESDLGVESEVAFLATKRFLKEGSILGTTIDADHKSRDLVYWSGFYSYTSIAGFRRKILKFSLK